MRNFKKILISICVLALLSVGCVFGALAIDGEEVVYTGNVAELSELITTAERKVDAKEKGDAILAIAEYLENNVMDTSEEGYSDAMLRIQAVAVEGAELYFAQIPVNINAPGVVIDDVLDLFMNADELLSLFEIPNGTAGFSALKVKYDKYLVDISAALIVNIGTGIADEVNPQTAQNKIKLNKANRIITYCKPYGEEDVLAEIRDKFEKCVEAHNIAVAKKLAELDSKNDISNYDLPVYYTEDWEKKMVSYGTTGLTGWSYVSNGAAANRVGIRQEKNGNKYFVHEYHEKENPAGSFVQRGLTGYNAEKGLVFEFDIATFGEVPKQGILIETGSFNGSFPPPYMYINGNGDICSNDKSTVLLSNALTKGGWLHVILVLEPEEFVYKLYVEGQHLATYDAKFSNGQTYDHSRVALRLSGGPSTQGEIAYDNFKIYAGNNYRSQDKLSKMTDEEKLIYFVEYFSEASNPVLDRKSAHESAGAIINNFRVITDYATGAYEYTELVGDNEALKNAVDAYMTFDIDVLIDAAKTANLDSYVALVKDLRNVARSESSVSTREVKISEIDNFTKKNKGLIDLTSDYYSSDSTGSKVPNGTSDYEEYTIIFNRIVKQTEYDKNSTTFVKYIEKFEKATSLSATERYYNFAKEMIDNDKIDISLITDTTTQYRDNFKDLIKAYATYLSAQSKVEVVTKDSNAKKIVQCMNIISHLRTEEQWDANPDIMKEYLFIVKDIVLGSDAEGNLLYNPKYEGVDEAVRFFNRAYAYFYAKLQDEHVEYITYILGLISDTDDYVEKIGLVALIERYVEVNDIDSNDARINVLLNNFDTCKAELVFRGEDYSNILRQNSVEFYYLVEKMRTALTYLDQVTYFEQAALLYFGLDTTVENTAEAIEIFDEYKIKLANIKESSVRFLEAVSIYRACETAEDKYVALVDCYYNAQFAELSYDGVEEAMAEYMEAYEDYMNYVNAVNEDVSLTGNAVGSLRINSGITTVVAVIIKKIFGI